MINWLRTMFEYIWNNRNRRIVAIAAFADVLIGIILLDVSASPWLSVLAAMVMAYTVSTLTRERYLTLGASCIAAMQIVMLLLLEPVLNIPLANAGIVIFATAVYIILMMSMITSIQQQEYFSTAEADRQLLYKALINQLLRARGLESIYASILNAIGELYGRSSVIFAPDADGEFKLICRNPEGLIIYSAEYIAAEKAFLTGRTVGRFGDGCDWTAFMFMPIVAENRVLAVVGVLFADGEKLEYKHSREIAEILSQSAKALEYQHLADEQQQMVIESERERIRANFLRAMSHDIRSPLTGIMSASSTLLQSGELINENAKEKLLINIHEEAEWLCHMVENLLSITKVSNSAVTLKKSPELVEDILSEVQKRCQNRFPQAKLQVISPDEPLVVPMDATLIIQVLMNLIENSVKYSRGCNYIDLKVSVNGQNALFSVKDYGIGLSAEIIENLFSPVDHTDVDLPHGLGIGLSICRSVINAHGGEISGQNSAEGGAIFTFTLPLEDNNEEQNDTCC